jgi:hypothetical protein
MPRLASALLLLTPLACAQVMVPPGQLAGARLSLEPHLDDQPLRCEVTPLLPTLNFAFRYEAGYDFHVPQSQSSASSRGWSVAMAITPEHGAPAYLIDHTTLAQATKIGLNFNIRGIYMLGVGRYTVEATLRDDRNRVCRKQWPIVVAPSHTNRAVPLAIAPGKVVQLAPFVPPDTRHHDNAPPIRLTVMLNAAAFSMYRTAIRPYDRSVLLGALTSLIEHLPATSIRLVVFSLEQQREVFRAENFSPSDVGKVANAIRTLDEATVDVHVLQKPEGHIDFLAGLIGQEIHAAKPADTIVFLGPTSRYGPFIPKDILPTESKDNPKFFYVRYGLPRRPPPPLDIPGGLTAENTASGRASDSGIAGSNGPVGTGGGGTGGGGNGGASGSVGGTSPPPGGGGRRGGGLGGSAMPPPEGQSDIITAAVGRLKGRTLIIHTPAELARAIRKIEGKR